MKTATRMLLAGAALAVGCGQSAPYAMVKVSGSVTYDDGSPIPAEQIQLRFDSLEPPIDAKTHPRPGMASAGPDGRFSVVTTNKYGDGLIRGKHKLKVSAFTASGDPLVPTGLQRDGLAPGSRYGRRAVRDPGAPSVTR